MKKIVILGAGMVGRAMAKDLSAKHIVTSTDIDSRALDLLDGIPNLGRALLDVTDHGALARVIEDSDIVLSAVPGFLGMQTMTQVIKNRKDLVDISFLPEEVSQLDGLAKTNGVTVVMDCGVAPGIPNYVAGYHNERMKIDELNYMVGGLPLIRRLPFEYKAPFSPCDVIEEYTRPARFMENGQVVVRPAMSDTEYVDFDRVGTLEAFNTDGLRSLLRTMRHIPDMKEKTLRYPGHIGLVGALKQAGFFDSEPVVINDTEISPLDFTSKILFNAWKLEDGEPEFTVMRITIRGTEQGIAREIVYDLYDEYDTGEKVSSMARTTGFTATGTAEMILAGLFTERGVFPPELVGRHSKCFDFIIRYLQERNVHYKVTELNG